MLLVKNSLKYMPLYTIDFVTIISIINFVLINCKIIHEQTQL